MTIPVDRTDHGRLDLEAVASGRLTNVPSDHMFLAEYAHGEWRKARIQPYRPIPMAPFAIGLHYAQSVFEGMKAYRYADGHIGVFRMERHHARLQRTLKRMCMPEVPFDLFQGAILTLLDVDRGWVPNGPDSAYYLRPLVFATEERMGLKSSDEFLFMVMGGPFRPLFAKPLRVKVEREYSRAAPGGTGFAKCAGNYAAAMYPTQMAKEQGFDQVLWTDAFTHQHIEESGAMNVAFVIDDVVVTPPLSDTILDGVTRASVLELAREAGYTVEERTVDVAELAEGIESGSVTEAFGVGTAASIAPIETISIDGVDHTLKIDESAKMFELRRRLNAIRFGETTDTHSWMTTI